MAGADVIQFPAPKIERYVISYNPLTHETKIPILPGDRFGACVILGVLMDQMLEAGALGVEDLETILESVKIAQMEGE